MKEYTDTSLRHLDLSDNFFYLVQAALQENIKQSNRTISVQSSANNQKEAEEEYLRQTKWSDNRILIPVLFNFFHGVELFLKGFKYLNDDPAMQSGFKPNHKLSDLLGDFKDKHPKKIYIIEILDYYIFPENKCEILSDFYKNNNLADSNMFIEVFKYPSDKRFTKQFNFKGLRSNGHEGIDFFKKIIRDIDKLREEKRNFE